MPFPGVWPFDTTNYCHLPRSHLRNTKFYKKKNHNSPTMLFVPLFVLHVGPGEAMWAPSAWDLALSAASSYCAKCTIWSLIQACLEAHAGQLDMPGRTDFQNPNRTYFKAESVFLLVDSEWNVQDRKKSLVSSSSCERHRRQAPHLEWPPRAWGSYTQWSLPYNLCSQSVR